MRAFLDHRMGTLGCQASSLDDRTCCIASQRQQHSETKCWNSRRLTTSWLPHQTPCLMVCVEHFSWWKLPPHLYVQVLGLVHRKYSLNPPLLLQLLMLMLGLL